MSRPRTHKSLLPEYVRIRNGSYLYKDHKLCRVVDGEAKMYDALAKKKVDLPDLERIPQAVAQFKLDYLPTLSPSARKEHSRLLDVFSNDFSEFKVSDVTAVDVRRCIKNLYRGKETAARAFKSRISRFFRWCVEEEGLRAENPCREVWLPKPVKRKTKWTDELFWSMRGHMSEMYQCYHDLSVLMYQRTTDVRYLRRAQDLGAVIHFEPTKTEDSSGAQVDIPVTPAMRAVLDRAAAISKKWKVVCGYVIHTHAGTPFTRSGIYSAYLRADKALHGEPLGLNPKALRPYAATLAKKQGFTTEQLQEGLAHATIRTTEEYIHQHETPVSQVMMRLPEQKK